MKRIFDFFCALIGLSTLIPVFIIITTLLLITGTTRPFYLQTRIGRNKKPFKLIKFRSMYLNAHLKGELTVGGRDPRITPVGYYLRKYKIDELPQLINVLNGTMSLVGPRPEVKKYVDLYSTEQSKVLTVRPGITDYASIKYFDENKILEQYPDPEKAYIEIIMPHKLQLNLEYIHQRSLLKDIGIIFKTVGKMFK